MNITSQQASIKARKRKKLICGVGINDADYQVKPLVNGVRLICPFYSTWVRMLERCYSSKFHKTRPTYIGCSVSSEWLIFSQFKAWMEKQDFNGKQLDKDLLVANNRIYGPDYCLFVTARINTMLNNNAASRGDYAIGVDFHNGNKKFRSRYRTVTKHITIGYFNTEQEAHQAYLKYKKQVIIETALEQDDIRLKDALLRIADTYEIQS